MPSFTYLSLSLSFSTRSTFLHLPLTVAFYESPMHDDHFISEYDLRCCTDPFLLFLSFCLPLVMMLQSILFIVFLFFLFHFSNRFFCTIRASKLIMIKRKERKEDDCWRVSRTCFFWFIRDDGYGFVSIVIFFLLYVRKQSIDINLIEILYLKKKKKKIRIDSQPSSSRFE